MLSRHPPTMTASLAALIAPLTSSDVLALRRGSNVVIGRLVKYLSIITSKVSCLQSAVLGMIYTTTTELILFGVKDLAELVEHSVWVQVMLPSVGLGLGRPHGHNNECSL